MSKYPRLIVNTDIIYNNNKIVNDYCNKLGISVTGVVKGFDGMILASKKMYEAGCKHIASSRISHLKNINKKCPDIPLMLIRIPMLSELKDVIKYCDISLNSEKDALIMLDKESKKQSKKHKVILMRDLRDLREGVFLREDFIKLALFVENELNNLELLGIGTNLSCYGSIRPTYENLTELSEDAKNIEMLINRELEIVSGGGTTTLPLLIKGKVPSKINHLRIGEGIINTQDLPLYWDSNIDGLNKDSFILQAEIIEINEKPTHPIGEMCVNAFGDIGIYEDKGIRKRAIVALGNFDIGDCKKLIPRDNDIKILGASSDHTILDIHDSKINYKLGDIIEFNVLYQAMLVACASSTINKKII